MNITAAALFPGVDGLGRSIAELTSLGMQHAAGRTQGLSVNRRRTPVAVGSRSSLQPERTERAIVHDGECPIVFTGAVARRSDLAVSAQACVDGRRHHVRASEPARP